MGKRILWAVMISLSCFCLCGVQLGREIDTTQLIRLHVLANSDSEADQALKLLVKNEVVAYMQQTFGDIDDVQVGREVLLNHWDEIESTAAQALMAQGSHYDVHLEYGYFPFPVKYYGSFSLPAGTYEALRVIIGDGAGSNWWCVLFPPMCFVDSNTIQEEQYSDTMPQEKLVVKWRLAEWWNQLTAESTVSNNDISADCL